METVSTPNKRNRGAMSGASLANTAPVRSVVGQRGHSERAKCGREVDKRSGASRTGCWPGNRTASVTSQFLLTVADLKPLLTNPDEGRVFAGARYLYTLFYVTTISKGAWRGHRHSSA